MHTVEIMVRKKDFPVYVRCDREKETQMLIFGKWLYSNAICDE